MLPNEMNNVSIELQRVCCARCGTHIFLDKVRHKDIVFWATRGKIIDFYCPNGHPNNFVHMAPKPAPERKKKPKADNKRLRELHEQEQREAREAESPPKPTDEQSSRAPEA